MAQNCDSKIATSITYNACNPPAKGLKSIGYLCNFDDINQTSMKACKVSGKNLYSDIKLNSNAHLYQIFQAGKTPFSGATSEAQVGVYRTTWNKTLPCVILDNGAEVAANIIDKLANGKFVAIVENAFSGTDGDNTFEIIGLETGLCLSEGNNEKYNEDYGGGWSMTLVESNAPTSALYLFDTDEDTTRTLLNGYLVQASNG